MEIWRNTLQTVKNLVEKTGIDKTEIAAVGLSNQRETALIWDREDSLPVADAVVWQCARGAEICERLSAQGKGERENRHQPPLIFRRQSGPGFWNTRLAWRISGFVPVPSIPG